MATSWDELLIDGRHFRDKDGRYLLPRGVNVAASSKLPSRPNGASHSSEGVDEKYNTFFSGRPFPADSMHEHFSRLKHWGLTFWRLLVPWESLEHAGPGIYDEAYMDEIVVLAQEARKYGIIMFIDVHQDVWSRYTGGSGAPAWTLELVGFNIDKFKDHHAAHVHAKNLGPDDPPAFVWPSGYTKLAVATMNTIFWAGDIFAPDRKVKKSLHRLWKAQQDAEDLVTLQFFLQSSMLEAYGFLADKLAHIPSVCGIEIMNEPHRGYIGLHSPYMWDLTSELALGYHMAALHSWSLGAGYPTQVDYFVHSFPVTAKSHHVLVDPEGSVWNEHGCIWEQHGVWGYDPESKRPVVLRHGYFQINHKTQKPIDWYTDCFFPYGKVFYERMQRSNPRWISFMASIPNEFCPQWPEHYRPPNLVYAPHWYDLHGLFTKKLQFWNVNVQGLARGMFILKALYFGYSGRLRNYTFQFANIARAARAALPCPVIIGETGVPFDLGNFHALRTGDFSYPFQMMDCICSAMESALLPFCLWVYNPENTHAYGDSWNREDFSIFSKDNMTYTSPVMDRLDDGARVLDAFNRPYSSRVAGVPLLTRYNCHRRQLTLHYRNATGVKTSETLVYVPRRLASELKVNASKEKISWTYDHQEQTLSLVHENMSTDFLHRIIVHLDKNASEGMSNNILWIAVSLLVLFTAIALTLSVQL